MEQFNEILSNPIALTVIVILSIASTYYSWIGLRNRNPPLILIGIGIGIPTFDLYNWQAWAIGALITSVGWILKSKMENL